jgi:hypothetical protein
LALGEKIHLSDREHLGEVSFVLKILKIPEKDIQKENELETILQEGRSLFQQPKAR